MYKAKLHQITKIGSVIPNDKFRIKVEFTRTSDGNSFIKEYELGIKEMNGLEDFKLLVAEDLRLLEKTKLLEDQIGVFDLENMDHTIIVKQI